MKELREYQTRIVNKVLDSDKDIVICLPTGSGKTVIASDLISKIKNIVVFIVPRLELIKQAKEEFGDVDVIWADHTSVTGKHCIIASKDSLRMQYNNLTSETKEEIHKGTVIIDEAHVSLRQSFNLVSTLSPSRVLGLTATPERMDGMALLKGSDPIHKYGIFDELLQEETVPSLIKKGYLSNLKYYARPIEGISEIKPENLNAEELSDHQMTQIFNEHNIWGDLVKSYEEYGKGRPALGFTTTIAMGEKIVELFTAAGYDFRIIHGEMTVKERQDLIDMLSRKEIDGLVNAALLTYGFNCPQVSYAFCCRHIKSRTLWFQIVGRILRICEGKENAIFIDHGDSISEFSEPDCSLPILDETIQWRVDGETKEMRQQRKKARKKVQDTMSLIQELDPLPADMVEVTVENTWERLVRIIKRLRKENAALEKDNANLSKHNDVLSEKMDTLQQKTYEMATSYRNISVEKQQLIKENEELKKIKPVQKIIDPDETFDYIRRHYISYRIDIEYSNPGISREEAHRLTEEKIKNDGQHLPFIYDNAVLNRSLNWWYNNFEKRLAI